MEVDIYSKHVALKSKIEDLFGRDTWCALKESDDIGTWRKCMEKTLKALHLSIHETVKIYDEAWMKDVDRCIQHGLEVSKIVKTVEELISALAATLLEVSFLQTGFMPRRKRRNKVVPLRKEIWKHDIYRQVVYLQTEEQKKRFFWSKQQREIGFEKQKDLYDKYMQSGVRNRLSYFEWCKQCEKLKG